MKRVKIHCGRIKKTAANGCGGCSNRGQGETEGKEDRLLGFRLVLMLGLRRLLFLGFGTLLEVLQLLGFLLGQLAGGLLVAELLELGVKLGLRRLVPGLTLLRRQGLGLLFLSCVGSGSLVFGAEEVDTAEQEARNAKGTNDGLHYTNVCVLTALAIPTAWRDGSNCYGHGF